MYLHQMMKTPSSKTKRKSSPPYVKMQSNQRMVKPKSQTIPLKRKAPTLEALQGLTQQVLQASTGRKRQILKKQKESLLTACC